VFQKEHLKVLPASCLDLPGVLTLSSPGSGLGSAYVVSDSLCRATLLGGDHIVDPP
jgi:hypothetical protein